VFGACSKGGVFGAEEFEAVAKFGQGGVQVFEVVEQVGRGWGGHETTPLWKGLGTKSVVFGELRVGPGFDAGEGDVERAGGG